MEEDKNTRITPKNHAYLKLRTRNRGKTQQRGPGQSFGDPESQGWQGKNKVSYLEKLWKGGPKGSKVAKAVQGVVCVGEN